MTNASSIVRSLLVYGLCLPLAVYLGYLLAMPMDQMSFILLFLALAVPLMPVLLRWHHPLLILSWNMNAVLFFFQGHPNLWIVMACLSLTLSIAQHILNKNMRFVHVPSVAWPLFFLTAVILVTARLTGGIGMESLGASTYGGKRYVFILSAIIGYFALTAHRVPRGRAALYVALFFLGGLTWMIASLGPFVDPSFRFIFWFFPVENITAVGAGGVDSGGYERFGGVAYGCLAVVMLILARHGIRGVFNLGERWGLSPVRFRGGFRFNQPWRLMLLLTCIWGTLLMGGYRAMAIMLILLFFFQFLLEGLHRTALMPALAVAGLLVLALALPFTDKLPMTVQRSISFLPVKIDPVARYDVENSTQWRLAMWRVAWLEVPKYILLGQGYGINPSELQMALSFSSAGGGDNPEEGSLLAGDYHNGPLSVVIPLGIYGVVGFLWFLIASLRVLYNNYRYGEPELKSANTMLLAFFIAQTVLFLFVFGSFYGELFKFTGLIGLSVSLNGGMCRKPEPVVVRKPVLSQFKLARVAS
jgi:O-Antigen ligase